jgi:hypothetical protein
MCTETAADGDLCVLRQVSVFLFDDAHASHWRLPQGTLLALFNTKVRGAHCQELQRGGLPAGAGFKALCVGIAWT